MAWRSGGVTNADLISNLFRNGLITTSRVRDAMLKVDRAHYCPSLSAAYQDSPQSIGHAATISAPHMHASACESLLPYLPAAAAAAASQAQRRQRPLRVLDIGSGSGYLTHVLAELVGGDGCVVGVEHIVALRDLGEENMRKSPEGRALLESGRVRFVVGDGRKGWVDSRGGGSGDDGGGNAPGEVEDGKGVVAGEKREIDDGDEMGWDAIHVGAAAVKVHEELIAQLRRPGRIFIPVNDDKGWGQHIYVVDKDEKGNVSKKKLYGVSYVPLTDAPSSSK